MSDPRKHAPLVANKSHTVHHDRCLPKGSAPRKLYHLPTASNSRGTILRMGIGHRIKKAREDAGFTQRELAHAIKVSIGLVGQWENHTKKPGRETLRRLAEAVLVDVAVLLSEKPTDPKGVLVSDENELAVIRRLRQLSPRQRENVLELLGVAVDIRRQVEQKGQPAKP